MKTWIHAPSALEGGGEGNSSQVSALPLLKIEANNEACEQPCGNYSDWFERFMDKAMGDKDKDVICPARWKLILRPSCVSHSDSVHSLSQDGVRAGCRVHRSKKERGRYMRSMKPDSFWREYGDPGRATEALRVKVSVAFLRHHSAEIANSYCRFRMGTEHAKPGLPLNEDQVMEVRRATGRTRVSA
jgi:hypothetical protein